MERRERRLDGWDGNARLLSLSLSLLRELTEKLTRDGPKETRGPKEEEEEEDEKEEDEEDVFDS
jgi:hypothetical protein